VKWVVWASKLNIWSLLSVDTLQYAATFSLEVLMVSRGLIFVIVVTASTSILIGTLYHKSLIQSTF